MATNLSDESGHSNRPCASVLGGGGAVTAEVLTTLDFVAAPVVLGAVVLGAVVFEAAVLAAAVELPGLGPVALGGVVVLAGAVVFAAAVVAAVPVDLVTAAAAVGDVDVLAAEPVDAVEAETPADPSERAGEFEASTPVIDGLDELLTSAAGPGLRWPAAAFDRPAIMKTTPINTAMAAAINTTRRSQ